MKLKFINLLLVSGLLVGSAQVFTSCKDNEADLTAEISKEYITLSEKLKNDYALKQELTDGLNALKDQLTADYEKADKALSDALKDYTDGKADNLQQQIDALTQTGGTIDQVQQAIDDLKDNFDSNVKDLIDQALKDGKYDELAGRVTTLETQLDLVQQALLNMPPDLTKRVEALETFKNTWESVLPEIQEKADSALAKAQANEASINAANKEIEKLQNSVDTIKGDVQSLQSVIEGLQENIKTIEENHAKDVETLREEAENYFNSAIGYTIYMVSGLRAYVDDNLLIVNERINQNAENIAANTEAIAALDKKLDDVLDEIDAVKKTIDQVITRVENLENRITSITLEGCENDIIGYFATPVGVTSNILMAFCGQNNGPAIDFPYTESTLEYNNPEKPVLTDADLSLIQNNCGLKTKVVASGARLIYESDGNLGTVYFSVNPVNIDLTGKSFALVNSCGEKSPVALKNVRPCTSVKTFGYSRANTSASGYYMADATVNTDASLQSLQIEINQGLKDAASSIINTKKVTKGNLVQLAKGVYNQLNGILPALAVNSSWTENGKTQATNSTYGVAAAIFQPLSFTTLYGKSFGPIHMPTTDFFDQFRFSFDTSNINIDLSDIKFDVDFEGINLGINLNLSCQINDLGALTVTAVVHDVPDGGVVDAEGNVTFNKFKDIVVTTDASLAGLQDKLNAQLKSQFDNMNDEINDKINAAFDKAIQEIKRRITSGVNDMLDQVQAKIDETLADVVEDLQNQVNDHIEAGIKKLTDNRVYDAVEKGLEKINEVIGDPNHYMQPTLLYGASGKYGILSSVEDMPTVFQLNGGNAVTLVATTYNAEIVTPAYLKYVAVTNVWKYNDKTASADNGNAAALKLLKAANAQKFMNQPIVGQRQTLPLSIAGGSGYVYEIVYQALDYHGRTSTNKYYVRVK